MNGVHSAFFEGACLFAFAKARSVDMHRASIGGISFDETSGP